VEVRSLEKQVSEAAPQTEEELINSFVQYATAHRELFLKSDIKGSNRAHDKLIQVAVKFRQLPDRGERMLRELIRSNHENVRTWAAYFLLTIDAKLAIRTMQDIAATTESATTQISNETTIKEWRAGRLDVDWFLKKK
jgi:hypothetical protein